MHFQKEAMYGGFKNIYQSLLILIANNSTFRCKGLKFAWYNFTEDVMPGRVAQSVGHLTRKSEDPGSIPGLATYFRFCFR